MGLKARACRGSDGKRVHGRSSIHVKARFLDGAMCLEASVCKNCDGRASVWIGGQWAFKRVNTQARAVTAE
jgi:hypothetical protein